LKALNEFVAVLGSRLAVAPASIATTVTSHRPSYGVGGTIGCIIAPKHERQAHRAIANLLAVTATVADILDAAATRQLQVEPSQSDNPVEYDRFGVFEHSDTCATHNSAGDSDDHADGDSSVDVGFGAVVLLAVAVRAGDDVARADDIRRVVLAAATTLPTDQYTSDRQLQLRALMALQYFADCMFGSAAATAAPSESAAATQQWGGTEPDVRRGELDGAGLEGRTGCGTDGADEGSHDDELVRALVAATSWCDEYRSSPAAAAVAAAEEAESMSTLLWPLLGDSFPSWLLQQPALAAAFGQHLLRHVFAPVVEEAAHCDGQWDASSSGISSSSISSNGISSNGISSDGISSDGISNKTATVAKLLLNQVAFAACIDLIASCVAVASEAQLVDNDVIGDVAGIGTAAESGESGRSLYPARCGTAMLLDVLAMLEDVAAHWMSSGAFAQASGREAQFQAMGRAMAAVLETVFTTDSGSAMAADGNEVADRQRARPGLHTARRPGDTWCGRPSDTGFGRPSAGCTSHDRTSRVQAAALFVAIAFRRLAAHVGEPVCDAETRIATCCLQQPQLPVANGNLRDTGRTATGYNPFSDSTVAPDGCSSGTGSLPVHAQAQAHVHTGQRSAASTGLDLKYRLQYAAMVLDGDPSDACMVAQTAGSHDVVQMLVDTVDDSSLAVTETAAALHVLGAIVRLRRSSIARLVEQHRSAAGDGDGAALADVEGSRRTPPMMDAEALLQLARSPSMAVRTAAVELWHHLLRQSLALCDARRHIAAAAAAAAEIAHNEPREAGPQTAVASRFMASLNPALLLATFDDNYDSDAADHADGDVAQAAVAAACAPRFTSGTAKPGPPTAAVATATAAAHAPAPARAATHGSARVGTLGVELDRANRLADPIARALFAALQTMVVAGLPVQQHAACRCTAALLGWLGLHGPSTLQQLLRQQWTKVMVTAAQLSTVQAQSVLCFLATLLRYGSDIRSLADPVDLHDTISTAFAAGRGGGGSCSSSVPGGTSADGQQQPVEERTTSASSSSSSRRVDPALGGCGCGPEALCGARAVIADHIASLVENSIGGDGGDGARARRPSSTALQWGRVRTALGRAV
jgi:hypothetical protein